MRKIAAIVAAAGIVSFAGAAMAHHKDGHDQGQGNAHGAIGCSNADGSIQGENPADYFNNLRDVLVGLGDVPEGANPNQLAEHLNERVGAVRYFGVTPNVGALIANSCGPNFVD